MVRIISAVVLAALIVGTVWFLPPWATVALATIVAAIAAVELAGLSRTLGAPVSALFLALATALVALAVVAEDAGWLPGSGGALAIGLLTLVVASGAVTLSWGPPDAATVQRASLPFFAACYVGVPIGALAAIRVTDGAPVFMALLVILAVSDSAQYYTGRQFGRRKLAPSVSPAKTVEGAMGGLVAAAIVGAWLGSRWIPGVTVLVGAFVGLGAAAVGMVGDLFESLLKRGAGVKDSSALIPGHGGVLDRIDSYLFAAPLYYVFLRHLA